MKNNNFRYLNLVQPALDPATAAWLSIVPGVGQLYNGQRRKGILFLDVAAINFLLLWLMFFTEPLVNAIASVGKILNLKPNQLLVDTLRSAHLGSPASIIFLGILIMFVAYAVRDAYEQAATSHRRRIYPEQVIEMNEAANGSYLLHLAIMGACLILAIFLLVPKSPSRQVMEIEFIKNSNQIAKPADTKIANAHNSPTAGKSNPDRALSNPSASHIPKPISPLPRPAVKTLSAASMPIPALPKPMPIASSSSMNIRSQPTALPAPVTPLVRPPVPSPPSSNPTRAIPTALNPLPSSQRTPSLAPVPQKLALASLPVGPSSQYKPGLSTVSSAIPLPSSLPFNGLNANTSPSLAPRLSTSSPNTQHAGPLPSRLPASEPGSSRGSSLAVAPVGPSGLAKPSEGQNQSANSQANSTPNAAPSVGAHEAWFGAYMAELQRRIKHQWSPPRNTESKRVVVTFKIHRGGELSHLKLSQSSGLAIADDTALAAVEHAAPFAHLPEGAPEDVDIQFTFDYNVFGDKHATFRQF